MNGPGRTLEAVPPQYGGEKPSLEGYMYVRTEKKNWTKRFCKLYRERIDAFKKDPAGSNRSPSESYPITPNHYVQGISARKTLKKRKHAFMLSDFENSIFFSGMADPSEKQQVNVDEVEHKMTAQWLQVLGKHIASLQSKKKWWIKTDTSIDMPEDELDEDFRRNIVKYKRARGANVDQDKETEKETEAAIARVFVNVAAERASVRMFSKQEKEEEYQRLQAEMKKLKQAQQASSMVEMDIEGKEKKKNDTEVKPYFLLCYRDS